MRNAILAAICLAAMGSAAYIVHAQADHQVDDKGYQDIGSYTETATKKRPSGSLYAGSGIVTYIGRPPKPYIQHDMGGYELDPSPNEDRNKPYNHHDLMHSWEHLFGGGLGRVPTRTAAEQAQRKTHITDNDVPILNQPTNDAELTCDPLGWPRSLSRGTRPFEFFQFPNVTLIHFDWHEVWVKIYTDGRLLPKAPIDPTWVGYSVGKWVGDTFVMDTNGVDERVWLNAGGDGHSFDATFQSRWRRIDHNTLQENMTINDPAFYAKVWSTPDELFELYPHLELDILPCAVSEELEYRDNTPTEMPQSNLGSTGDKSIVPPQGASDTLVRPK